MTLEEFLALIRKEIGVYCTDAYWEWKYKQLADKSETHVRAELPYLAINAIATDRSHTYV